MGGAQFNIHPTETGDLLTGRITDDDEPVAGVEVTAYASGSSVPLANTTTARNRMGCSENWYDPYFCLGQTFTKEELESFSEEELERMLKLASTIGEGLY